MKNDITLTELLKKKRDAEANILDYINRQLSEIRAETGVPVKYISISLIDSTEMGDRERKFLVYDVKLDLDLSDREE